MRNKTPIILSLIFCIFFLLLIPVPDHSKVMAAETFSISEDYRTITSSEKGPFNVIDASGEETNALKKNGTPYVNSGLEADDGFTTRDYKLFKAKSWVNGQHEGNYYIRIPNSTYENARAGYTGRSITGAELWTLNLQCVVVVCYFAPAKIMTISTLENPAMEGFKFYWDPPTVPSPKEPNYLKNTPPKIISDGCCGTLTTQTGTGNQDIYTSSHEGKNYRIVVDLTNSVYRENPEDGTPVTNLDTYVEANQNILPPEGMLHIDGGSGIPVQILNTYYTNIKSVEIVAQVFVLQDDDSSYLLANIEDYMDTDRVSAIYNDSFHRSGIFNDSASSVTFKNVDINGDYTIEVNVRVKRGFEAWKENTPENVKEALLGHGVACLKGTASVSVDNNSVSPTITPETPRIILEYDECQLDGLLTDVLGSVFGEAIKNALLAFMDFVSKGIDWAYGLVDSAIEYGNDLDNDGLKSVWRDVRNMALGLVTLALLIIAFANILNIQLEQYGLTRMVPRLISVIILTFFSYLIAQALLNVASALGKLVYSDTNAADTSKAILLSLFSSESIETLTAASSIGYAILLLVLGVITLLVMLWIALLLLVRMAVIYFLVALAPFAFLMMLMPFTEFIYKDWWKRFWTWAFMGPIILFLLWIANTFLSSGFLVALKNDLQDSPTDERAWLWVIMYIITVFMAGAIPLKLGKEVFDQIKKHGDKAPGVKTIKAGYDARKSNIDTRRKQKIQSTQARMANAKVPFTKGRYGVAPLRWATGMSKEQAAGARDGVLKSLGEEMPDNSSINETIEKSSGVKKLAAIKKAAESGLLDAKDPGVRKDVIKALRDGSIKDLDRKIGKEQGDFFTNAAIAEGVQGDDGHVLTAGANARLSKTSYSDYKEADWNYFHSKKGMASLAGDPHAVDGILNNSNPENRSYFMKKMRAEGQGRVIDEAVERARARGTNNTGANGGTGTGPTDTGASGGTGTGPTDTGASGGTGTGPTDTGASGGTT